MVKKTNKNNEKSGFPEDSYTENFIKVQENLYNFDNKINYDFEAKARRPLVNNIVGFIFSFFGAIGCFYISYEAFAPFLKESNIIGIVVIVVMGGGLGIVMLMGAFKYFNKIRTYKRNPKG